MNLCMVRKEILRMSTDLEYAGSPEEIEFVRSVIRLLRLMRAYETGEISYAEYWREVLEHLTLEDAQQLPESNASKKHMEIHLDQRVDLLIRIWLLQFLLRSKLTPFILTIPQKLGRLVDCCQNRLDIVHLYIERYHV